jgi:hypothetical protein
MSIYLGTVQNLDLGLQSEKVWFNQYSSQEGLNFHKLKKLFQAKWRGRVLLGWVSSLQAAAVRGWEVAVMIRNF